MADVVVTVPMGMWPGWLREGELPGQAEWPCFFCDGTGGWCEAGCDHGTGRPGQTEWDFYLGGRLPDIDPDERVYIVAHGRLRGYSPLVRIDGAYVGGRTVTRYSLVRGGDGVAVTIDEPIRGFQGFRYRWWDRAAERPFPEFATEDVRG